MLFIYVLYEAEKFNSPVENYKVNQSDSMFSVKGNFYIKGIPIFMHLFVSGNFCCHNSCV